MTRHAEYSDDVKILLYESLRYGRQMKDRNTPRGTLFLYSADGRTVERTVPGFPHIKRVYRLDRGVRRRFGPDPFHVEEKLDGYNARCFRHRGAVYGTSRGGFICPFTTEWMRLWTREHGIKQFFADWPEHVLCGEVVGDNPYNPQRDPNLSPGAHFFVFEILAPDATFLPPEQRYRLLDRYGLPSVPRLGLFDQSRINGLYDLVLDLNRAKREGIVLKSADGGNAVKFVMPKSDMSDIQDNLPIAFDLPFNFFLNRCLRAALFTQELHLDADEYALRLGRAFLEGCPRIHAFQKSSEHYTVYVAKLATWEAFREHVAGKVVVAEDERETVRLNGRRMHRIRFRRVFQKSTDRYRRMLKGYAHQD